MRWGVERFNGARGSDFAMGPEKRALSIKATSDRQCGLPWSGILSCLGRYLDNQLTSGRP